MVVRVVCSWIIQTNFIGSVSARRNSSHGLVSCALASLRLRSRPFPSCLSSSLNELDLLKARGRPRADAYSGHILSLLLIELLGYLIAKLAWYYYIW